MTEKVAYKLILPVAHNIRSDRLIDCKSSLLELKFVFMKTLENDCERLDWCDINYTLQTEVAQHEISITGERKR